MPREPALLASAGRMPERSQHRVSGAQDGRSERPAMGRGLPLTGAALIRRLKTCSTEGLLVGRQLAASFRRSAATTGCGTNFRSASSSASGVICFSSDDEMCE